MLLSVDFGLKVIGRIGPIGPIFRYIVRREMLVISGPSARFRARETLTFSNANPSDIADRLDTFPGRRARPQIRSDRCWSRGRRIPRLRSYWLRVRFHNLHCDGSCFSPPQPLVKTKPAPMFQSVAYDAANFSSDSGSFGVDAGDVSSFEYWLAGDLMIINFYLVNTTITGTPAVLKLKIPASKSGGSASLQLFTASNNGGAWSTRGAIWFPSSGWVSLMPDLSGAGTWAAGSGNNNMMGSLRLRVQ